MSIARHRLDLLLLPPTPDDDAWAPAAVARLRAADRWPELAPGFQASFGTAPTTRFFGNRQGGFHVRCPIEGTPVAGPFSRAVEAWRTGGPRTIDCPCGTVHPLEAMDFAPPAGFARAWISVPDVPEAVVPADVAAILGAHRVVGQRG